MASSSLCPLPENKGLTFTGEPSWSPATIYYNQAQALINGLNPTRRPNREVLRCYVGACFKSSPAHWQIDFPSHFTEQEAALYLRPFLLLQERQAGVVGKWWINPHANPTLRNALARLDRFLVTPVERNDLSWNWIEGEQLPDSSLLVVARDDDFTLGLLRSRLFALWWQTHFARHAFTRVVESFPFPWRPSTPLGSLSGWQQDIRIVISRATRSGTSAQIAAAAAAAYGWSNELGDDELLANLTELNRQRAPAVL